MGGNYCILVFFFFFFFLGGGGQMFLHFNVVGDTCSDSFFSFGGCLIWAHAVHHGCFKKAPADDNAADE